MSNNIIKQFPFTEKMAVITRIYQECDEFRISQIVNDFLDKISQNVNEQCDQYENILTKLIVLKYRPTEEQPSVIGYTKNGDEIYIYKIYNSDIKLEFKYFLVHELVHVLQGIYEKQWEDYTLNDLVQYRLLRPYIDAFINGEHADSPNFIYTLYFTTISEMNAYPNNAYEKAFSYKSKNPNMTSSQIMKNVLDDLGMSKKYLTFAIDNIKNNNDAFTCIIYILLGHFSGFGTNKPQRFFSKEVFNLKSVKELKTDMFKQIHSIKYADADKILKCIKNFVVPWNMINLNKDKNIIIENFIEHLKYWFDKLQKKLGKAIQLGIDDVIEFEN